MLGVLKTSFKQSVGGGPPVDDVPAGVQGTVVVGAAAAVVVGAAMVVVVAFVVVVLEELLEPHAAAPREITDKTPAIRMVRLRERRSG